MDSLNLLLTATLSEKSSRILALEEIYYIFQIIGTLVLIGTLIAAIRQYHSSKEEFKEKFEFDRNLYKHDRRKKAIELSGFYKDNILNHTLVFRAVYQKSGIKDVLDKIHDWQMVDFDEYELERNFTESDLKKIKIIRNSNDFIKILIAHRTLFGFYNDKLKCEDGADSPEFIIKAEVDYSDELNELLNNLEFFSMHFTTGVADEEVVYQSLHKTFLSLVELFYYDISLNNVKNDTKLFTNVIKLYNRWKEKSNKAKTTREIAYRSCGETFQDFNSIESIDL